MGRLKEAALQYIAERFCLTFLLCSLGSQGSELGKQEAGASGNDAVDLLGGP